MYSHRQSVLGFVSLLFTGVAVLGWAGYTLGFAMHFLVSIILLSVQSFASNLTYSIIYLK